MTARKKGGAKAPPTGRGHDRKPESSERRMPEVTLTAARRWFAEVEDMTQPPEPLLEWFVEVANAHSPQPDATFEAGRWGQQFLTALRKDAPEMVAFITPSESAEEHKRFLDEIKPGLGDLGVEAIRGEIAQAWDIIEATERAVVAFLNWQDRFDSSGKDWHDVARHLEYAARLAWTAVGCPPSAPTPHSPLTTLVRQALTDLGFRGRRGRPLSRDTVSAVLTGKRGGRRHA